MQLKSRKRVSAQQRPSKNQQLVVHSEEEVMNALATCKKDIVPEVVERTLTAGEVEMVLKVVADLSIKDPSFRVNGAFLDRLASEFRTLSFMAVRSYADLWIEGIINHNLSARNFVLLLDRLVVSVDLYRISKLRDLLKAKLPLVIPTFLIPGKYGLSALLLNCLVAVTLVEFTYSNSDCTPSDCYFLDCSPLTERSSHFLLCSFAVKAVHGSDSVNCLKALIENFELSNIECSAADPLVCARTLFFALLEKVLAVVLSNCEDPSQSSFFVDKLVCFHDEKRTLIPFASALFSTPQLTNGRDDNLLSAHFCFAVLRLLSAHLNDFCSEKFGKLPDSSDRASSRIASYLSTDEKACETAMREFVNSAAKGRVPEGIENLEGRVNDCVALLAGDTLPLWNMPRYARCAFFGALFELLTYLRSPFVDGLFRNLIKVYKTDVDYFRVLFRKVNDSSIGSEPLGAVLERQVPNLFPSSAGLLEFLFAEYLYSSPPDDYSKIYEKVKLLFQLMECAPEGAECVTKAHCAVLRALAQYFRDFLEQGYMKTNEGGKMENFFATKILPTLYARLEKLVPTEKDVLDFSEMERNFSLLKCLPVFESVVRRVESGWDCPRDRRSFVKECLKACSKLSGWSDDASAAESSAIPQIASILKMAVDFLADEHELGRLFKWKYITAVAQFDVSLLRKVLLDASVDEVQQLMNKLTFEREISKIPTRKFGLVMQVCTVVASMQNANKRSTLRDVSDTLFVMMCTACEEDLFHVLKLVRALLQIWSGSDLEKRLVSVALGCLSCVISKFGGLSRVESTGVMHLCEVELVLIDLLRLGTRSVCDDERALFGAYCGRIAEIVQRFSASRAESNEIARMEYLFTNVTKLIYEHKEHFARVAPLLVAEMTPAWPQASLAVQHLVKLCDPTALSMIGVGCSAQEKADRGGRS